MPGDVDLAATGALLADPARARILVALLGGEHLPAGELARRAGISASGASNHLAKLLRAGLVDVRVSGRRRLYRLGAPEVAAALEALGRIAPPTRARTLRAAEQRRALERARTCYDHLAGRLGVRVTDRLVARRILREHDGSYTVTAAGRRWFADALDVDTDALGGRRRLAYACQDLTERRAHVAGSLGAALADSLLCKRLLERVPGGRTLRATPAGSAWLRDFGVTL